MSLLDENSVISIFFIIEMKQIFFTTVFCESHNLNSTRTSILFRSFIKHINT